MGDTLLPMPKGLAIVCLAVALATATAQSSTQATEQSKDPSDLSKRVTAGPKALFTPSPIYPHDRKIDGSVKLFGYVGTDGKFHDPKVVRSLDPTLDALAVEAVGRWKFKPATRDGVPVNCSLTIEMNFKLAP